MTLPEFIIAALVGTASGLVAGFAPGASRLMLGIRLIGAVAVAVCVTTVVVAAMRTEVATGPVIPGRGVHTIEPPDAAGGPR